MPRSRPVLAVFFIGVSLALLRKVDDFDIWYHLVIGNEVLRTGGIPTSEFYKYPVLGQPAGFHEWGFGVLAALAHRVGGVTGLAVANALLGAAAVTLTAAAASRRGASVPAVLFLVGPLAVVASSRFIFRPEVVLYVAIAAELYALERARVDRRWLYALPALSFALALCHPSPVMLVLVAGCYWLDELLIERSRRGAVLLGAAILGSVGSAALAPHGVEQLMLPFAFARQVELTRMIAEFQPTMQSAYRWWMLVLSAVAAAGVLLARPRRLSDVLIVVGFGYLGFSYVRNVAMFALVAFGPVAVALSSARELPRIAGRAAVAVSLAAGALLLLGSGTWGVGTDARMFPKASADLIEAHRPQGSLLNSYDTGGYFAWRLYPEYLVAVDGRTYYGIDLPMRVAKQVLAAEPGWREVVDRYNITMIFTPAINYHSGQLNQVVDEMYRDPSWSLAVSEPAGMLFVRSAAAPAIRRLPRDAIWSQVRDAATPLATSKTPAAYLARGTAHFKLRDFRRAADDFTQYAALVPEDTATASVAAELQKSVAGDPAATRRAEAAWAAGRQLH